MALAINNKQLPINDNAKAGTNPGYDFGSALGSALNSSASLFQDIYKDYAQQQMEAAMYANGVSAAAQAQQYAMNQQLMQSQYDLNYKSMIEQMKYNSESAKMANELQKELFYKAMEYNSKEAQANRDWETSMSNTAYQRAVADMRAAGINPILAAQNGGATVGSGATASINSGNASMRNGVNGGTVSGQSVGSYSGSMYHLNDSFALIGSALGSLGNILSAAQASGIPGMIGEYMYNGVNSVATAIENAIDNAMNKLDNKFPNAKKYARGPFDSSYIHYENKEGTGGGGGHYF